MKLFAGKLAKKLSEPALRLKSKIKKQQIMNKRKLLNKVRKRREQRVRKRILKEKRRPRLSLFRSNLHIYVQLIDDKSQKTLASASSLELKNKKMTKTKIAEEIGKLIAERAQKLGVKKAVLDRKCYQYHGRIKALAEAARKNGLII